jgi:hypothetical protein
MQTRNKHLQNTNLPVHIFENGVMPKTSKAQCVLIAKCQHFLAFGYGIGVT